MEKTHSESVIERTTQTQPAKKEYTPQMFVEMYNKLCEETGYTIAAHPEWRLRDDSTYSLVVILTVEKKTG